ncbi:unnamed protein product [Orchesella dallaii]|uniref:Transmembrane protein n=1 Tax=Orchesella dallaii TaxID=48710 RepID=A0ABP1QI30_9HEXA
MKPMFFQKMEFFRFGLPLGVALILSALVETTISAYEVYMDVGSVFVIHWNTPLWELISTWTVMLLNTILFLQVIFDVLCLWFGTILMGNWIALLSWIVMTSISVLTLSVVWVHHVITESSSGNALWSAIYTVTLYTLFYLYLMFIAIQCLPHLRDQLLEEIQPIGKGFSCLWRYFARNAAVGARFLLTAEVILNVYFFLSRKLPPVLFDRFYSGHEDDDSVPVLLEEYYIRALRLIIAIVGIVLVHMDKQKWMKLWCLAYAIPLVTSFIIFFYMAFQWIAEHEVLTYGFFIFFAVNISFRFIVFLVCLLYSNPHDSNPFSFVAEFN